MRTPAALGKASVIALHLLPGAAAYLLLHFARRPVGDGLGVSDASVQIGLMTVVMFAMAAGAVLLQVTVERRTVAQATRLLGLRRWDPWGLLLAVVFAVGLLALPTEQWYEQDLAAQLQGVEWLDLDPWHFQGTDAFTHVPAGLAVVALLANIIGEELWFRGYLQPRLGWLGRGAWLVGGLLFIAYHVFEAPIAYPRVLGGLALAGLYALRRDIWSCMLLHTLLQAPV